jgi:hypothetical protein
MQRILVLQAPYGAAFMFAKSGVVGDVQDVWLLYDSSKDEEIRIWVQNLSAKLVGAPVPEERAEPITKISRKRVDVGTAGHDWGGPYKIGSVCSKCLQVADGLERQCKLLAPIAALSAISQSPKKDEETAPVPEERSWVPKVGDLVMNKINEEIWTVESGEGERWAMVNGPVIMLKNLKPA